MIVMVVSLKIVEIYHMNYMENQFMQLHILDIQILFNFYLIFMEKEFLVIKVVQKKQLVLEILHQQMI